MASTFFQFVFWYGNLFSLLRCSTLMHAVYSAALWYILTRSHLLFHFTSPISLHIPRMFSTTRFLSMRLASQQKKSSPAFTWHGKPRLRRIAKSHDHTSDFWHRTFFMLRMTCAVSRLRTLPTGLRASRTPRICCCLSWLDHNCNKYEDASQTDSNGTLWPMAYASRMIPLPAQECNTVQQQQQQQAQKYVLYWQNTSKYIKIHQNDKTPIWSTATLRVAKFHTSSDLVFRSGRKKLSWYGELGRACRSGLCKSDQFCFVKKLLQGDLVSFLVIQSQSNGVLNMRRNTQPKATLWYP